MLTLEHLVKEFPIHGSRQVVHAVNGVNLTLTSGEALGLVGESGSGKTTVGRCIVGLEQPTSGRVIFNGVEVSTRDKAERRIYRKRVQMVFQDPQNSLHPRMTVQQILLEPIRLWQTKDRRQAEKKAEELTAQVGLPKEALHRFPHQLGSGQQQRVAIARALATDPDLIVLDEPTSALDPSARAQILALLERLREQSSVSFLFISHDLTAVMRVAQRIAVMYLGKIVEVGPTDDVMRDPKHPYTRMLLDSVLVPEPDAYSRELNPPKGEIPSPIKLPQGCHFYSRCPLAGPDCLDDFPPLSEVSQDHHVACYRVTSKWANETLEGRWCH